MIEDHGIFLNFHRADSIEIVYPDKPDKIKQIGRYILGDKIGEGSYSKVKEAIDTVTLERRAIKIMKRQRLKKIPNGEQNVKKEIELLRRLDHKNVIKLIEKIYSEEKEKLYIVMEYCFMVLQELIENAPGKKFPIWQSHRYFTQLLDGLEYLHSQGVVHNDIKPGNLLINTKEIVKIIDFGVSQLLDKFEETDYCVHSQGTPAFQPPEIAQGQERFQGFKVDVWAAGITLFKFVTGYYPFEGDNVYILFENISKAVLEIPNHLDDLLQSLLKGLLERDVNKRLTIAEAENHCWVRRTHPKYGNDEVKVNERFRRQTSVLPYLKSLHNCELEDEEDEEEFASPMISESPGTYLRKEFWRFTKLNINNLNLKMKHCHSIESNSNDDQGPGCSFINQIDQITKQPDLSQSKRSIYDNMKDRCNPS